MESVIKVLEHARACKQKWNISREVVPSFCLRSKILQAIELHSEFLCVALFGRSSGIILARGSSLFQSPLKFYTSSRQHHSLKKPNMDMKLRL